MTRSNAREIVAHLIFELCFTEEPVSGAIQTKMEPEYYSSLGEETEIYSERPNAKQMEYIDRTVSGIREKTEELDGYIAKYAVNWSVSRISKVARAILHVAMYEAIYVEDVPVNSAINEAVELTKKYEDNEVVAFVNGILGSFAKDLENK